MLDGEYKGGLFEGLNQIIKISDEIENQEPMAMVEKVPHGVDTNYCDGCESHDCCCDEGCQCGSSGCKAAGSAGSQPKEEKAILGSENSEEVGEMTTQQLIEESIVNQVQSIIKSNFEESGKDNFDPLGFFKEPVKVDLYEPEIKYGQDMIK